MIDRLHLGNRHAPSLGGGGFQHGARRCADLTHRYQVVSRAARTVGVLVAEFDFVAMGLLDMNPRPVGFHFVGDDHRKAGADAGAHFRTMGHDGHSAVGCDGHEHARIHHRPVRHLVRSGDIGRHRLA